VLTTRTPDALAQLAAKGVDVRFADFDEPATLERAFAFVDRLLLISARSSSGDEVDPHRDAIHAARAAGVSRIVFTSMPNVDDPDHPVGWPAHEYRRSERTLEESATGWTILRNGPYIELNVLERLPELFGTGQVVTNAGDGRSAFISRGDCAAVAIEVLTSDGHDGRTYDIWGSESITWGEIAGLLSEVSGRDVAHVPIDDLEFADLARRSGMQAPMVQAFTGMGIATRQGYFDGAPDVFEAIMHRRPKTLRDVLEAHRDEVVR
jgi:NAD(P)H dehydrogenase (quinone)